MGYLKSQERTFAVSFGRQHNSLARQVMSAELRHRNRLHEQHKFKAATEARAEAISRKKEWQEQNQLRAERGRMYKAGMETLVRASPRLIAVIFTLRSLWCCGG